MPHFMNVATIGEATQSSTYYNGVPNRAVDSNIDPQWSGGSCSCAKEWWMLTLPYKMLIDHVIIYNNIHDSWFQSWINGSKVYVNNEECGIIEYVPEKVKYVISCSNNGTVGDTVTIFGSDNPFLVLCEVEVMVNKSSVGNVLISY